MWISRGLDESTHDEKIVGDTSPQTMGMDWITRGVPKDLAPQISQFHGLPSGNLWKLAVENYPL